MGTVSALWRALFAALLLACALAPLQASAGAAYASAELDSEVAFLVGLAPFIDWPPDAFSAPESPLVICAVASDPLARRFAKAGKTQKDGKRPIRLRVITSFDPPDACHILYLGSASESPNQTARAIARRSVLTVSHAQAAAYEPSMIVFTVDHGRVRFDIDDAAALNSGLAVSSKLLALARNVTPPSPRR